LYVVFIGNLISLLSLPSSHVASRKASRRGLAIKEEEEEEAAKSRQFACCSKEQQIYQTRKIYTRFTAKRN